MKCVVNNELVRSSRRDYLCFLGDSITKLIWHSATCNARADASRAV